MRLICLLALTFAPAFAAAQTTSSPLVESFTPHDSRSETPSLKALNKPAKKAGFESVDPAIVQITKMALPENDVCLTMRVYQHSAANPKTLTSYTECQKVGRHGIKNADLVLSR